MHIHLTQGAARVLKHAETIARSRLIGSDTLLAALLDESECRAADWLSGVGITRESVQSQFFPPLNLDGTVKLEMPISAPGFPVGAYGAMPPTPSFNANTNAIRTESISDRIPSGGMYDTHSKERLPKEQEADSFSPPVAIVHHQQLAPRKKPSSIQWMLDGLSVHFMPLEDNLESSVISALQSLSRPNEKHKSVYSGSNGVLLHIKPQFRLSDSFELATEHLLFALALDEDDVGKWLRENGVDPIELRERILPPVKTEIATAEAVGYIYETPTTHNAAFRILDAAANRAGEAIRVIEDYVRFALDDKELTLFCKELRHRFSALMKTVPQSERLEARNSEFDVGTEIEGEIEYKREDQAAILTANFSRLQESLRSLEEYAKLAVPEIARGIEQLRYRSYTLQKKVQSDCFISGTEAKKPAFPENALLYVLIDCCENEKAFTELAQAVLEGGADCIQLRDKKADDKTLLERARLLRKLCATMCIFIVNDRADIAVLAKADGVHVGQDELSISDVRQIVGSKMFIGKSTHSIEQAEKAVCEGADYIGVGPTFPSKTKEFDAFPGLDFLREAARVKIPAFAIGGIDLENAESVFATGIRRIAVSSAVTKSSNPKETLAKFKSIMRPSFQTDFISA